MSGFPKVICRKCQKEVDAGDRYCQYCGTKISEVDITPPDKPKSFESTQADFEEQSDSIIDDVRNTIKDLKNGGGVGEKTSGKAKKKVDEIFNKDKK